MLPGETENCACCTAYNGIHYWRPHWFYCIHNHKYSIYNKLASVRRTSSPIFQWFFPLTLIRTELLQFVCYADAKNWLNAIRRIELFNGCNEINADANTLFENEKQGFVFVVFWLYLFNVFDIDNSPILHFTFIINSKIKI